MSSAASAAASVSIRSGRYGRTNSQMTRNSRDTDTNTSVDYLGDNLLEGAIGVPGRFVHSSAPPTYVSAYEGGYADSQAGDIDDARLVIAIDFGTTFTGVAFALTASKIADLGTIQTVIRWGEPMNSSHKIPSVKSHSAASNGERQWGADLSPQAVVHKNFKLLLDAQRKRIIGLELTLEVLEGTGNLSIEHVKRSNKDPAYAYKPPTTIVTEYLSEVFAQAWKTIEPQYLSVGTAEPLVDLVVTVPAGWSYQATNSTLRAVRDAGFNETMIPTLNDTILLTEPEAASHFTVRHLQKGGSQFLKQNEPFILVDAGGGTVDVVAYQPEQHGPHLELKQVSEPTSEKCGAAYIDTHFKRWLFKLIGKERYSRFDPSYSGLRVGAHTTESSDMRQLIKQFEEAKKSFSNSSGPIKLDLPGSLSTLTIPDVIREGELTLQPNDMKALFNLCVKEIIPLVKEQKSAAERHCKSRVRNILLVGGFGESLYLQEELERNLRLMKVKVHHPGHMASWTAVVQGAVIYGIERDHHEKLKLMRTLQESYGIVVDEVGHYSYEKDDWFIHPLTKTAMAREQFAWVIRKGDLVLSEKTEVAEKDFTRTFRATDNRRFEIPVYVYPDEDDDPPDRWATGQNNVTVVGTVRCDINLVPRGDLQSRKNYETGETYVLAYMTCKMRTSFTSLEVEVYVKETSIGRTTITIGNDGARDLPQSRGSLAGKESEVSSLDS